jgi:PAS domain S-box-containing protein
MRDETRVVMAPDGRLQELIGSWVDITPQRDTEEALRRSEASFRSLLDQLPQAIFVRSGTKIVYANTACAALLAAASAADLTGRDPIELAPPSEHAVVRKRMFDANTTGRSRPHESEWQRFDGSTVPVEVEAFAIEYRGIPSVVVMARDLSERRAMVARMAAADRMLAHATLAAGVAHEINGPLAFVLTNLSILAKEVPGLLSPEVDLRRRSRADIEHLLSDAQEGAIRVRDVVRDLRLLSGPVDESGARCDLGAVLSSCARMAWPEIEGRARLVTDIHDVMPVRGSATRLSQVFSNLIANAIHAIAPGRPNENEIRLTARRRDADTVLVEVADTGVGMAPELLARIFEPFFTTKAAGVGTGLGLAICQSVVAAVGGAITVESEVGRGTRCSVVLPIANGQLHSAPAREAPNRVRRGRVLVVDDDPLFARSLQLLLDEHEVLTFTSSLLALDRIRAKESFDVVLCDLNMPDLDGLHFHSRVNEIEPNLARRIIFVTGGAITPEGAAFIAKNRSLTLEKPFDPSELTALVARAVDTSWATAVSF